VLYAGREIVGRTSGDSIALQRYKTQVVRCLSHRDSSIRRRALDVVSALVDANNVEQLIPEVLDYVKLADAEFRVELVAKIFTAVQRFAPTPQWNFDTVHRILIDNGNYVGHDLVTAVCRLIARTPELQPHALAQLSASMLNFADTQTLMQVTAWALGEFLVDDDGAFDALRRIVRLPQTSDATRGYALTALAKLAVRFGRVADVADVFAGFAAAQALDVQQRAGEARAILALADVREEILAPVDAPAPRAAVVVVADGDEDLLGLGEAPERAGAVLPEKEKEKEKEKEQELKMQQPPPGAVEALRKPDYVIFFEVRRNPQNPKHIAARASAFNTGVTPLKNFTMKFGVPVGWNIQTQPPSSTTLAPIGGPPIFQQFVLFSESSVQLVMKTQIGYVYGAQPITEQGVINPIFG
jgi:hypothetical protein